MAFHMPQFLLRNVITILSLSICYAANPAIQAVSDVVTIEAGSSGQLKVYISGVPNPTSTDIAWFKVGPGGIKTEIKEPTVNFSSDHRTLLLSNIEPEDGGIYQCIVSQSFLLYRSANVYINVTVLLFPGRYVLSNFFFVWGRGGEGGGGGGGGREGGRIVKDK